MEYLSYQLDIDFTTVIKVSEALIELVPEVVVLDVIDFMGVVVSLFVQVFLTGASSHRCTCNCN